MASGRVYIKSVLGQFRSIRNIQKHHKGTAQHYCRIIKREQRVISISGNATVVSIDNAKICLRGECVGKTEKFLVRVEIY